MSVQPPSKFQLVCTRVSYKVLSSFEDIPIYFVFAFFFIYDKVLQFLTGWKSSISTILKNSSSVDQGAPNLWSRCWCWSRSSKRNVIVSDARDSHCHSACNAGVDKSKVKLQVIFACSGPWAWKMGLSAGSLSPVPLSPSCRLCGLLCLLPKGGEKQLQM